MAEFFCSDVFTCWQRSRFLKDFGSTFDYCPVYIPELLFMFTVALGHPDFIHSHPFAPEIPFPFHLRVLLKLPVK